MKTWRINNPPSFLYLQPSNLGISSSICADYSNISEEGKWQMLKTLCKPTNRENLLLPLCDGTLLSHKKEGGADRCHMDKSRMVC